MDSPINRFRREDLGSEPSGEGVSEMDFRLVSIEDELKTVSLSSAMQARDFQALRAKVESLETKTGGDINETLSRVFDHVEAQDERIELVLERIQVLDSHIQELKHRLDNLGDIGPLENLPNLLEQSLVTSLDDLEARLELKIESGSRTAIAATSSGISLDQFEQLKEDLEARSRRLAEDVDKLLENRQEEVLEMIQESTANQDTEQLKVDLAKEMDQIRQAVVELQEAYEAVPTREDLERVEAKSFASGGGGASSDDLTLLAGEFSGFKEKVSSLQGDVSSLRERVSNLGEMGGQGDWQGKLDELMKFSEQAASHQEKVDEAMRLVAELEQKTKNLESSTPASQAHAPDDGLAPPPGESNLKLTLRDLVREMVKNRVSDLHIKTGRAITARIGRELIQFSTPPLSPADAYNLIASALKASHRKRLVEERDIEFVYQYESIRLRANVFFDRGNLSATFKMLSNRPPELENLGLPKAFSGLLNRPSGLVLVCGLPGSGRSTTLTASLDYLNRTKQLHLVSLEDRLDFTHEDRRSLVTQREMGADIVSFSQGVKRAIGQDSDVVFLSDLADKATMEAVFSAVDSGLLVVGSITAQNPEDAIPRLINLFPESERKMRARLFSRSLQGILSLKLFDRVDGEGQIPASELLLANSTVKRLIEDANLSALYRQVVNGGSEGMQTFADSIERLIETGMIDAEVGKAELERLSGGRRTSGASASAGSSKAPVLSRAEKRLEPTVPSIVEPVSTPAPPPPPPPSSPPASYSSGESQSVPPKSSSKETEAFGEEDTLMNWL